MDVKNYWGELFQKFFQKAKLSDIVDFVDTRKKKKVSPLSPFVLVKKSPTGGNEIPRFFAPIKFLSETRVIGKVILCVAEDSLWKSSRVSGDIDASDIEGVDIESAHPFFESTPSGKRNAAKFKSVDYVSVLSVDISDLYSAPDGFPGPFKSLNTDTVERFFNLDIANIEINSGLFKRTYLLYTTGSSMISAKIDREFFTGLAKYYRRQRALGLGGLGAGAAGFNPSAPGRGGRPGKPRLSEETLALWRSFDPEEYYDVDKMREIFTLAES
jgi:hypothetical protein